MLVRLPQLAPGRRPAPPMTLASADPAARRRAAGDPRLGERGARAPAPGAAGVARRAAAGGGRRGRGPRGLAGRAGDARATPRWRWPSSRRSGSRAHAPPAAIVLGADQILSCEGRWFAKPARPRRGARPARSARRAPARARDRGRGAARRRPDLAPRERSPGSGCGRARPAFLDAYLRGGRRAGAAPRSAPTRSRARARSCSRGSRATTSRSRACRCSRCWSSCASRGCWRDERRRLSHRPGAGSPASWAGRSAIRSRRACTATGCAGTASTAPMCRSRCRPTASSRRCARCRRSAFAAAT